MDDNKLYGCFQKWGYPHSPMVFVRENAIYKWMMTGGSPILGKLHMLIDAEDEASNLCFKSFRPEF